ncbi:ester cyclase [Nocardiopsis ansamitocini]|uniref:Ester cyclase n=1 Tax=Nocardiopsis ansamitocini TaxID=1670832 RepID=A0A9W6PAY2_9ACTN|nr:ester cyclase [Nocardiopsis ansamitocini]GLU50218.1 hypothetical protein Nans01_45690 [Nocardiopsis ansamitocini]
MTLFAFPHPRYGVIALGVVRDGDEAVRGYYADSRRAFPDQHHEVIRLRHSDDAVICGSYLIGTHLGPFGSIPATGNESTVRLTAFFVFEDDVLVCERIYFDVLTMLKQLLGGLDYRKPKNWLLLPKALRGARKELG